MKPSLLLNLIAGTTVSALCLTSCGEDRNGWTIDGKIEGASDKTVYIERPSGTTWIIVDSLQTDPDGNFEFVAVEPEPAGSQPLFRLRLDNKCVYFTVDGNNKVSLAANAADFGKKYRLTGNTAVTGFTTVDSLVNDAIDRVGATAALNDSALIASLGNIIVSDTTCIVSYYAITRTADGHPIFTSDSSLKTRLIGAAANLYNTRRPDDARGKELRAAFENAKKAQGRTAGATMEASMANRPSIQFSRPDINGNQHDLDAVLDRGGVTVLNLSRYDSKGSAANTAALGQLYDKYKAAGLEIFQVGFDPNEAAWRQTAARLPWITVYNRPGENADILIKYNANPVDGDPISFVFNRQGELVARVTNPADLEAQVAKLL